MNYNECIKHAMEIVNNHGDRKLATEYFVLASKCFDCPNGANFFNYNNYINIKIRNVKGNAGSYNFKRSPTKKIKK